jgi:hypothetical protein
MNMSTNPNEATATESKAPKAKTVADDMTARRIFPTLAEAIPYLQASARDFSDFATTKLVAPGMDSEGNFDAAIYDGKAVMVSLLRKQGKGVKAIVVAPIPTLEQLLADKAGTDWIERIVQKELNHVAVRHLRDAEDVTQFVDQIPTTLEGYITSGRDGGGGVMEAFDDLYKSVNATLAAKIPAWSKARFTKGELRKSLESTAYAAEYYPALEDYKGESLFVMALQLATNAAKRKGLDPTIFERWTANRDAKAFEAGTTDEDEFDLDSLTDSLIEADTPAAPAADATDSTEAEQPSE